jgi:MFS family permease
LVVVTGLVALGVDFFLVGLPVYALDLGTPAWLPGLVLAVHTAVTSTCGTVAVRLTRNLPRTTTLARAAVLTAAWCGLCLLAALLPTGWRPVWLLASALVLAAAAVLFGARANALAVAMAPAASRGRHLAAFQYAFTAPGVLAPAVVALFAAGVWVPWAVVAAACLAGAGGFRWLGARLPADVLSAASPPAR